MSTTSKDDMLSGFPVAAPIHSGKAPRFVDVAVTATAKEFAGIYRNKQYHEPDFLAVLDRALAAGVHKVMLTGMSLDDVDFNLQIARQRPQQCAITVGIHPYHASEAEDKGPAYYAQLTSVVRDLLAEPSTLLVAFGELGLDYDHLERAPKDAQLRAFEAQLDVFVSNGFDLPLFLHCRAAFDDFAAVITPYLPRLPRGGLVHSFVGTKAQMGILTNMGFEISVNGFSFRDKDSLEMIRALPLAKLQIETDAPWGLIPPSSEVARRYLTNSFPLPASKKRDKHQMECMVKDRNESCAISQVAFVVAGLKHIPVDDVMTSAWINSIRMFRLTRDEE
ncbi:hypothetical protein AAFC00_007118 [Neodothiora populina]|uniref:Mg-dependent DNase n=1 Tax=Neodothiora populina TaxID=2781224 RepID=A0ABR3PCC8_9PEZI